MVGQKKLLNCLYFFNVCTQKETSQIGWDERSIWNTLYSPHFVEKALFFEYI